MLAFANILTISHFPNRSYSMHMSRYLVSILVMSLYSIPVLIVLGILGHTLAGTLGSGIAVALFVLALFSALLPKERSAVKAD